MLGKKRLKELFLNVLALSIGLTVALILAEVILRVFTPNVLEQAGITRAAMYTPDPDLGWKLEPGFEGIEQKKDFLTHVRINQEGFRDDPYDETASGSVFSILGVGDSFTFGFGVEHEETYLELLEGYLNSSRPGHRNYQVFNTGVPGYSLEEYSMFLNNSWKKFDPDLVVIGVDINDHTDIQPYPKYDVVHGHIIDHRSNDADQDSERNTNEIAVLTRFKIFLYERFYLYRLLSRAKRNISAGCHVKVGAGESARIHREAEKAWEKASERLDQIRDLAEENDIGLVLVFIPHRSQVHPGIAGDAHIISGYFDDLDQRLKSYCRKNDILFANLLPYLVESAQRGEILYFLETDAHWNSNGHELAASGIRLTACNLYSSKDPT